jgi:hypothetical protein
MNQGCEEKKSDQTCNEMLISDQTALIMSGIKADRHTRGCKRENHLVLDEAAALQSFTMKTTKNKISNDSRASTRVLRYREGPACVHPRQKVEYPEEFTNFDSKKKI